MEIEVDPTLLAIDHTRRVGGRVWSDPVGPPMGQPGSGGDNVLEGGGIGRCFGPFGVGGHIGINCSDCGWGPDVRAALGIRGARCAAGSL